MSPNPRRSRHYLAAAGAAAMLALSGCGSSTDHAAMNTGSDGDQQTMNGRPLPPVQTTDADWKTTATALGRTGKLSGGTVYRVGFPRKDLQVTSYNVTIKPSLSLGSYVAFARYRDGKILAMGDLVVTETELPKVTDALQKAGIDQTALHKHLLAQHPDLWWTHIHAIGDPAQIARGVKAALDQTGTPAAGPPASPPPVGLDTAALDKVMGAKGTDDGGVDKFTYARKEKVSMHGRLTPAAMGVSTAIGFQPLGGGKTAAINGDFALTEPEVQHVIGALRRGGINIVELHMHSLDDQPHLFYMHFWATGDAMTLAHTLRQALDATAVTPAG